VVGVGGDRAIADDASGESHGERADEERPTGLPGYPVNPQRAHALNMTAQLRAVQP
jgi:hypothetical protein